MHDPPGEALRGLAHEVERGGSEQQEVSGPVSGGAPVVDDAAQDLEQAGSSLHLVDDAQPAAGGPQIGIRVLELPPVGRPFQIEIERVRPPFAGNRACERRLPDLPRSEERDGGHVPQPAPDRRLDGSMDLQHSGKSNS